MAGVATFLLHPVVARWEHIILTLDAAGLALFCVIGALKASDAGLDLVPAALLGMITAIGGGIARDVLANRVPVVLEGGWYATPALVGAAWAAFAQDHGLVDRRRAAPRASRSASPGGRWPCTAAGRPGPPAASESPVG